ncbi:MAG: SDR family oxidoreductase [Myxococcales bacterium]|nr:SDR family oxidoreductase [Myxococcales bacterium]
MATPAPRYLVTGATGFIGRHLVDRLVTRGARLHLLVRPGSRARVEPWLARWQQQAADAGGSVQVWAGDVEQPRLGLSDDDRQRWPGFDHVVHLAALYALEAPESRLRAVNVDGTRELLALLREHDFGGVLHLVSSVAVAGAYEGVFTETQLDAGQKHPHPYQRTKYEAEQLVRQAEDLRVRIYRPSAVVGHSITGQIDRIDGPYHFFKALQKIRDTVPRWLPLLSLARMPINMVPVDFVAEVLDHLIHAPGLDGQTFHVVDPAPPSPRETFNLLSAAAAGPRMAETKLGRRLLGLVGPQLSMASQLTSVRFIRDEILRDLGIPPAVLSAVNLRVSYDAANLVRALQGTGLACPPQARYLTALWDHWARHLDPDLDASTKRRRVFEGQHVLITGASSGVGRELALLCAELGAFPLLVARREPELQEVADRIRERGGRAACYVADVSELAECDRVVEQILRDHGHVDVLVNNAARSIRRRSVDSIARFHDFERTMQLNFFGALRMIRACLPGMRARKHGAIVNVLSAGARMPTPNFSAYMASKAALGQLTDTLGVELMTEGIHTCGVYLPWVRTPMMGEAFSDTNAMTPRRAAEWIVDGVVERQRLVADFHMKRRAVFNVVAPMTLSRLLNVFWRISTDEDGAHPEMQLDRMVAKRFIKGRQM